eukprot:369723-Amphidinium_carterae.1
MQCVCFNGAPNGPGICTVHCGGETLSETPACNFDRYELMVPLEYIFTRNRRRPSEYSCRILREEEST